MLAAALPAGFTTGQEADARRAAARLFTVDDAVDGQNFHGGIG